MELDGELELEDCELLLEGEVALLLLEGDDALLLEDGVELLELEGVDDDVSLLCDDEELLDGLLELLCDD